MREVAAHNRPGPLPSVGAPTESYHRARYYDPNAGRFIGEDAVGNDEGTNLYVYVHNLPSGFRDPTGLYNLAGFPPDLAQQMRDAIKSAIDTLKVGGCEGINCCG